MRKIFKEDSEVKFDSVFQLDKGEKVHARTSPVENTPKYWQNYEKSRPDAEYINSHAGKLHWIAKDLENLLATKIDPTAAQEEHIFEKAANNVGRVIDWIQHAEKVIKFTNQWIANAKQVYSEQYWKLNDIAVEFTNPGRARVWIVDLECQAIFT